MNGKVWCEKHEMGPDDERWKVHMEELEDSKMKGQVCPECYMDLKNRYEKALRNLKIQSRDVLKLRNENDRLGKLLDVVSDTIAKLSGEDPRELARKQYAATKLDRVAHLERGDLNRIIPNMIVQLARKGKKK